MGGKKILIYHLDDFTTIPSKAPILKLKTDLKREEFTKKK